jgi:hypothetical protein
MPRLCGISLFAWHCPRDVLMVVLKCEIDDVKMNRCLQIVSPGAISLLSSLNTFCFLLMLHVLVKHVKKIGEASTVTMRLQVMRVLSKERRLLASFRSNVR